MRQVAIVRSLFNSVLLTAVGLTAMEKAIAQSYPACAPPNPGEYLLLVADSTEETQAQLRQTLPPSASTTICTYLDNTVTRVGGFTDAEVANSWAQYLNDIGGLQAVVARPSGTTPTQEVPAQEPSPTPQATAAQLIEPPTYNPQPLAAGYAVLVDYSNRLEVAAEVQQFLAHEVGLVAYGQRPYLLATYTADPAEATRVLQTLSDRNFPALIIDSRRAVLLTPAVVTVAP